MKNAERFLVGSLKRYGAKCGVAVEFLSNDWIAVLSRGPRRHLVYGYDLGLNSAAAAKIANDKSAAYAVLAAAGVPAVEHRVFLHPRLLGFVAADGNWSGMLEAFDSFGRDAVIKDNEGTGGIEVFRVRTVTELEQNAHQLFQIARAVALSPFMAIEAETRFVMLEGVCVLAYRKERLVGEWRHNLGLGALPVRLDPSASHVGPLLSLAHAAMGALTLRFASIDVVSVAGRPHVLESNAGVMLEAASRPELGGPELADQIYQCALDLALAGGKQGDFAPPSPAPSSIKIY